MEHPSLEKLTLDSHLKGDSQNYVEQLYELWLQQPESLPEQWNQHFKKLSAKPNGGHAEFSHAPIRERFLSLGKIRHQARAGTQVTQSETEQGRVEALIRGYREHGHTKANIDPLKLMIRAPSPTLDPAYHLLNSDDPAAEFKIGSALQGHEKAPLAKIVDLLEATYCNSIGAEYMHITDAREREWIQKYLESQLPSTYHQNEARLRILEQLTAAEGLEKYLQKRYPGTKRFGLEGGETLVPMLDALLQSIGSTGCVEAVIGMAHRGRLNVLINILGKHPRELFAEFEGKSIGDGSGDVKYHQGFSSNIITPGGEMHLALGFNPSHLEIGAAVVEGSVRARQDRRRDYTHNLVAPIVIHGDAAFAGQGVVMEVFQMSQTRGFKTGGTIHLVVNNQIGFTTHRREDARSTEYCTEIAKMVQAPIFHVNGDDPEAAVFISRLVVDYRTTFKKDAVIDLVCYRRRGHNEAEDPSKTQPVMYGTIARLPTTRAVYASKLEAEGILRQGQAEQMVTEYEDRLENRQHVALSLSSDPDPSLFVDWSPYLGHKWTAQADTSFDIKTFRKLARRLHELPEDFAVHRQVAKIMSDRLQMAKGKMPVNWGFAEVMAYATMVTEGTSIRLTGQDCGVGTFSHRHACIYDQKSNSRIIPVSKLANDQSVFFDIYDSLLSEEAVLGFEYGYSTTNPTTLVIWEAQFGDFANGAQVIIDQFISSGEEKWGRLCGLVLLLPHGFEGAGPEHSSARLERYLQLCAEHNMQVCIPTTPAQIFHLLRRQAIRPLRKPLVVMSPKSLLRHKLATSSVEELCSGSFQTVIGDVDELDPKKVRKIVLCSGKVYYDLLKHRRENDIKTVAIIRLEQLYPFPGKDLAKVLEPYQRLHNIAWCQEEPMNQGAWYSSQHHMRRVIFEHDGSLYLKYVGRQASAAPATGYASLHAKQQQELVQVALNQDE